MTPVKAEKQQSRFQPGVSGNPAGRPKGSRNKATLAAEALLDGEAQTLTAKAIELAHSGDTIALRLCLDRILPPRRERVVIVDLPEIVQGTDAAKALSAILKAVAAGELTPSEAKALSDMVAAYANLQAASEASSNSRQAEIEAGAAEFDRRLALRIQARLEAEQQKLAVGGVASNEA
jgi:predicted transcriptional regulator